MSTFDILGERAPVPCDIGDADGVAMAFMEMGSVVTPLPFRQPALLDDQVRIKVTHAGLCQSDLLSARGLWGPGVIYPLVPGHEIVGRVEKIGEKVTNVQVGDHVGFGVFKNSCRTCHECRTSQDNLCLNLEYTYGPDFGGYSTSFQSTGDFFFKLDESFPGQYAPLFCAGSTVYSPIKRYVRPSMKVGVVGIGGLGHVALMFANKFGCDVTAISTSASKEAEAKEMGAHHFLNINDAEHVKKAQRSLDFIIDTSVKLNFGLNFSLLKPRGKCAIVGLPDTEHDTGLNLTQLLMNQQELIGSSVASRLEIEEMLSFIKLQNIQPLIDVYPFADTQTAVNSLAFGNPKPPKYRNVVETASFFKTFTPRA